MEYLRTAYVLFFSPFQLICRCISEHNHLIFNYITLPIFGHRHCLKGIFRLPPERVGDMTCAGNVPICPLFACWLEIFIGVDHGPVFVDKCNDKNTNCSPPWVHGEEKCLGIRNQLHLMKSCYKFENKKSMNYLI